MKKLLASVLACLGGLAAFTVESPARAADFAPAFTTSRAGGFIDLWPTKNTFGLWFGGEIQIGVTPKVFLDFSVSGSYIDVDYGFGKFQHAAYGNPTFGVHYADQVKRNFAFFVGGMLTFPALHDPDAEVGTAALFSSPMRGYYDSDRFYTGRMAIRAMGGIEWEIARHWYFRAEARPLLSIQTRRETDFLAGTDDVIWFLEHAAEGEYRLDNGLGFGLRLQGVLIPQANDAYQAMAEPFLALTPRSRGLYLRVGFPVALDRQLGFGFDDGRVATIRFSIGGQW